MLKQYKTSTSQNDRSPFRLAFTALAMTAFLALAPWPMASAEVIQGEGECAGDHDQTGEFCVTQGGNCNNYGYVAFWINSDCSSTQTVYYGASYCKNQQGGAAAGAGAGGASDANAGATAGQDCKSDSSNDGDGAAETERTPGLLILLA